MITCVRSVAMSTGTAVCDLHYGVMYDESQRQFEMEVSESKFELDVWRNSIE